MALDTFANAPNALHLRGAADPICWRKRCNDRRSTDFRRTQWLRPGARPRHGRDRLVQQPDEVRLRHAAVGWRPADRFDERLHLLPRSALRRDPLAQSAERIWDGSADVTRLGARPNFRRRARTSGSRNSRRVGGSKLSEDVWEFESAKGWHARSFRRRAWLNTNRRRHALRRASGTCHPEFPDGFR